MTKKKLFKALIVVIGCFVIFIFAFDNTWFERPLKATAGKALFNSPGTRLELECSTDFLGLTNHGEVFEFYQYTVYKSDGIKVESNPSLPNFENGLYDQQSRILQNVKSSSWQSTPVRSEDAGYMTVTEFDNLDEYSCGKQFALNNYLKSSGNYYAFFSAYPVGNFVYVWVPAEQKLFLIKKRG
ncbi:hypothetical protein [Hymenobacter cellulosivorans]|uniref:Uncharacterized protein n=1 Tax=Hymenobacter cellulosivorans TaxID=2932249 RepID=A0ABY4FFW6_9BACT|nr:hypothetical protein [Hymenobacter cellulosivorans]UOQ54912.1 hypothetical protein MUN80_09165 [Hymenobacter cellulosivorans]